MKNNKLQLWLCYFTILGAVAFLIFGLFENKFHLKLNFFTENIVYLFFIWFSIAGILEVKKTKKS